MKQFRVDVDFRVTNCIYIDAETPEKAEEMVREKCRSNPYQYTCNADSAELLEVTDVIECEPDEDDIGSDDLKEAMAYVREQLGEDRLAVVKAQATVCYDQRRPIDTDYNDEVHDLLEEYGQENDLPEGWWESECEIDEVLAKL